MTESPSNLFHALTNTDMTSYSSFDKAWMLDQIGGDIGLLREVAQVFLDDCPRLKNELTHALQTTDSKTLHAAAHAAKSAVGNFGARKAVDAANVLEKACKAEEHVRYNDLCQLLLLEIETLATELCSELDSPQQG